MFYCLVENKCMASIIENPTLREDQNVHRKYTTLRKQFFFFSIAEIRSTEKTISCSPVKQNKRSYLEIKQRRLIQSTSTRCWGIIKIKQLHFIQMLNNYILSRWSNTYTTEKEKQFLTLKLRTVLCQIDPKHKLKVRNIIPDSILFVMEYLKH